MMIGLFDKYGCYSGLTEKQKARLQNSMTYNEIIAQLIEDYFSSYRLKGLDDTMSERAMKEAFLFKGQLTIFEKEGSRFALGGAGGMAGVNLNGDFSESSVSAPNGFFETIKLFLPGAKKANILKDTIANTQTGAPSGVLVRENELMYPFIYTVMRFADSIADTYRTIDVMRGHMKRPIGFLVPKEDLNSVKDIMQRKDANEEYIVLSPKSNVAAPDAIKPFPISVTSDEVRGVAQLIEWYYARYYERLGIDTNANPDKAAQISVAEVTSNDQVTTLQGKKRIDCINRYFEQCNEIWGTSYRAELTVNSDEHKKEEGEDYERNEDVQTVS